MKRLIVNADDFGLHEAVNRGIHKAHVDGIVTSASLMAGGSAFAGAVEIAQGCPGLGVGVHLTLVGGRPISAVHRISSLLDGQGNFFASYPLFLFRYLKGDICLNEVEYELNAQLEAVFSAGISPTHLDSHQHLHVVPGISGIVLRLARNYGIRCLRIPAEPLCFLGGLPFCPGRLAGRTGLTILARIFQRQAVRAGFSVTRCFFGMLAGGRMNEEYLTTILHSLPEGDSEIMVHPGEDDEALAAEYSWGYRWGGELQALCAESVLSEIRRRNIRLISYREL